MATPSPPGFYEAVLLKIREERDNVAAAILNSGAQDFVTYKSMTSRLAALAWAESTVVDVWASVVEDKSIAQLQAEQAEEARRNNGDGGNDGEDASVY